MTSEKMRTGGQFEEWVSCYQQSRSGKLRPRTLTDLEWAVAKTLCAMGNGNGGTVFLGADEEGIQGHFLEGRNRLSFLKDLEALFLPPLPVRVEERELEGKALLQLTVPPSAAGHSLKNGKSYFRVGPQNIPLSKERAAFLAAVRSTTWHEREELLHSSLDDLDENLVADFLRHAPHSGRPDEILYRPYGLIAYREGRPLLTRAAVYLFAKDPLRWHGRPGIEFIRFAGREEEGGTGYNVVERFRSERPIWSLIAEMESIMEGQVRERTFLRDLFFREKFAYPSFAWKEALRNAIVHRDYSLEGSAIQVLIFDDRIEVCSPGKVPAAVSLERTLNRQMPPYCRNPRIARVLVDGGIHSGLGEGLPGMDRAMAQMGLNPPEISAGGNFLRVTLRNTPVMDEETLTWLERFGSPSLNLRQKRILAYARGHGMIFNSSDYRELGVDRDAAYVEIKDLIGRGIVQPLKKHSKVYRVRTAGEEEGALPGLPWVREALESKGFFTLADLRQPPSVSREQALEMMREMAEQGYLSLSGKGRGVRFQATERLLGIMGKKEEAGTRESAQE